MNALNAAIAAKLAADATLVAMLGTAAEGHTAAVYHRKAPEGAAMPYVIFNKMSGLDRYTLGTRVYTDYVYAIKGVCESPTDSPSGKVASLISERIDAILGIDGTLTISGHTQIYCRAIGDIDYPEPKADRVYSHVGKQYRIWST